jgi:hypothetical protein
LLLLLLRLAFLQTALVDSIAQIDLPTMLLLLLQQLLSPF